MKVKYTLDACVDCIAFVANGDIPEDRPDLAQEIADNLGCTNDASHLVNADGCDTSGNYYKDDNGEPIDGNHPDYELHREEWFSWSACQCCGSRLGGNRNRLAVLTSEESAT